MTGLRSKLLIGAVAAAMMMAASPSFAFVAWTCTAKDSHGHKFTKEVWGFLSFDTRPSAMSWTLKKCQDESRWPKSCQVIENTCFKSHA